MFARIVGHRRLSTMVKSLKDLHFDNRALKSLPIDPVRENRVRIVKDACFSMIKPTKLDNPKLVCYSVSALQLLDLNEESIDDEFIQCFAGNQIIPGSEPAAHCYCGHQFGIFAGQLGDGAAIYLGEIVNSRQERWELQLKGAGPTPYSREADGRKVLRSCLREFLCSEAMHHLGIGTTRSATCIVSDTKVERDQFYDGHPKMEPCAIISRLAPSFIRFGSFEIIKGLDPSSGHRGPSQGNEQILSTMINYVIETLFPTIHQTDLEPKQKYKLFYQDVVNKTAKLVAQWQSVGFVHGVLNTDNMSILGLTIDYGPFGFMDVYDPEHIPNTSDHEGRYRFEKQPEICQWNLMKFAEVLESLVPLAELKTILHGHYQDTYESEYHNLMLKKLGLFKPVPTNLDDLQVICDTELINGFLETLAKVGGDYTNCFRNLNLLVIPGVDGFEESFQNLKISLMEQSSDLDDMMNIYQQYLKSPMVYMRIILLQNFPERLEDGDDDSVSMLKKLQHYQHLKQIKSEQFTEECRLAWNSWLDQYLKRINYEIKDLDQIQLVEYNVKRKHLLNANNPCYILRNHLAQAAIEKAEDGDFSEARKLLKILENPFDENPAYDSYSRKPPRSSCSLRVSCSS